MDLHAPSHWHTLDFLSDVHLYDKDIPTFEAWRAYLSQCTADALFILGDLFEVWVGDDVLAETAAFEHACVDALRACTHHRPVFFLPGNRDFLVGDALLQLTGMQRLPDPTVLVVAGKRIALSHGDALCTDDLPYQQFRSEVRSAQWRREFLSKPLAQRCAIARGIRQASETRKVAGQEYTDVNGTAVRALMHSAQASMLIHGHTHEGASHTLDDGTQRIVLNDWCAQSIPPRLEIVQLTTQDHAEPTLRRVALSRQPSGA